MTEDTIEKMTEVPQEIAVLTTEAPIENAVLRGTGGVAPPTETGVPEVIAIIRKVIIDKVAILICFLIKPTLFYLKFNLINSALISSIPN